MQQLRGQTNFSIIIYIYTYKNIQKVLLLEFVQGEIVFTPYYKGSEHTPSSLLFIHYLFYLSFLLCTVECISVSIGWKRIPLFPPISCCFRTLRRVQLNWICPRLVSHLSCIKSTVCFQLIVEFDFVFQFGCLSIAIVFRLYVDRALSSIKANCGDTDITSKSWVHKETTRLRLWDSSPFVLYQ